MTKQFITLACAFLFVGAFSDSLFAQHTFGLSEDLTDSTGYLKPEITDQDSFYVVLNHKFDEALYIATGDSIEVKAGQIHLRYVKQYYIDVEQNVTVEPDDVKKIGTRLLPVRGNEMRSRRSSYPRLFWDSNNFVLSDPDTELYINGSYAGQHYMTVDTTKTFEVTGIHSSGREFKATFTPEAGKPFNFYQHYARPKKWKSRYLSFLPGGSQFYTNEPIKGVAFTALTAAGAGLAFLYETKYQDQLDSYNQLRSEYGSAINPEEAFLLGNRTEAAFDKAESYSKTRNRLLLGTVMVYVANIVDGFIAPSIGYRDESRAIDPYLDFDPVYRQPVVGVKSNF